MRVVHAPQGSDRLVIAARREQRDAAIPDHPIELERVEALGQVELVESRKGIADACQVEPMDAARFHIVRVQLHGGVELIAGGVELPPVEMNVAEQPAGAAVGVVEQHGPLSRAKAASSACGAARRPSSR